LRSRTIAEALAVIELLDERIAPLHQELRPFAAPTRVVLLRTIPGIRERLGLAIAAEIDEFGYLTGPVERPQHDRP
jgi:transposase